ncbi:globin-like [Babylonia areolata]|uniref:globin-like n=1 Tax=Babylonia areolata TaxID=304850 RepID=UPI003FD2EFDF
MNCVDINSGPHVLDTDQAGSVSGVPAVSGDDGRDAVTGLSAQDRHAIRHSWALVSQDLQGNGTNFMIRFFEDYPHNQDSFTEFRDVSLSELRHHPGLEQHAMRVMRALTTIVDSIDDSHVLVSVLHKTVDSHLTRSIRASQFTELLDVFGRFLADGLGEQFTADMATAWQIAVTAILAVVGARVKEQVIDPTLPPSDLTPTHSS